MKIKGTKISVLNAGMIYDRLPTKTRESFDKHAAFTGEEVEDDVPIQSNPEDFISVMYRQISATIVGSGHHQSTDFSNQEVLKKAIPMFKNRLVFRNHEMEIGNHVGIIGDAEWQGVTETENGVIIPAGINAPFIIDSKLYKKEAREMKSPHSPLRSVSITVEYYWESSHDFENEMEFDRYVGRELDGREVTRVVTEIVNVWESSLVWEGADIYAKKIGADGVVSFQKAEKNNETAKPVITENKNIAMENNKDVISMTLAEFEQKENAWKGVLAAKISELEAAKTENANLAATIKEQSSFVEYGKAAHNERVGEATRLYIASLNGKEPSEAMKKDIAASSYELLAEKIALFGGKTEANFTRTCNKCGCTDVSLKSSVQSDLKDAEKGLPGGVEFGF